MLKLYRNYALTLFMSACLFHACQPHMDQLSGQSATVSAYEHYMRALGLSEKNRYDEALAEIDQALVINNRISVFYSFRGDLLDKLDRIDEALAAYGNVLSLRDNEPFTLEKMGRLYVRKQRYDLALSSVKKAYARNPQKISLLLDMAEFEMLLDNAERAYNFAQQYRQLCHDEADVHGRYYCVLGRFYYGRKDYDKAVKNFETGNGRVALNADDTILLLKSYFQLKRLEEAFRFLMQVEVNLLAAGDVNYFRGLYYFYRNKVTDAKMQMELALQNNCREASLYYYLGKIYLQENEVSRARAMFQRFRELSSDFEAIQSIDPELLIEK